MTEQMQIKGDTYLVVKNHLDIISEEMGGSALGIDYSLWQAYIGSVIYILEIVAESERAVIFAGENENNARALFERIFNERTVPGNLYDIYRDMLTDKTVAL